MGKEEEEEEIQNREGGGVSGGGGGWDRSIFGALKRSTGKSDTGNVGATTKVAAKRDEIGNLATLRPLIRIPR